MFRILARAALELSAPFIGACTPTSAYSTALGLLNGVWQGVIVRRQNISDRSVIFGARWGVP
jgi:hypothetical protein